ncbi:COG1470 family protein [Paenibacillus sedimenti]|uniref:Alginate lyase domain-containing protein n=1 Tax=Paenibacillus sedimenti TaxID=2770274 RepID=A0A926KP82_9BACL|nr:hypothetical protein [Paenibacillus sedimenti]MBD0381484.1 hypothetical protein [Paenibacillus sedimenti]
MQTICRQAVLVSGQESVFEHEQAEDWRSWDALAFEICMPEGQKAEIGARVYPLQFGRPEYIECAAAKVLVSGRGWTTVEIGFSHFDCMAFTSAFWRMISRVGLSVKLLNGSGGEELPIRNLRLKKLGRIALEADRLSRAGEPGETVDYVITVSNLTAEVQAVICRPSIYGFESMETRLEPDCLLLQPGESGRVAMSVRIHDGVAPGGYEEQVFTAVPNGDANYAEQLTFYTVRRLPHPYILHMEEGWDGVRRNAAVYDWARKELEQLVLLAEAWKVPVAQGAGKPYAFELPQRFNLHAASVAWKLTGRQDLLEKAVLFLRRLADPVDGYPATDAPFLHIYATEDEMALRTPRGVKVCTGGLIHEGEFMLDVASCYDLLYDAGVWTEEDRTRMEMAFRLFIDKVDWMITDGDTNNIPSGGMVGALLCSLVLQDMHWIKRFIEGPGGFVDMVRTGIMDDGWYFEGASNYVVLFADMFTRLAQAAEPWGLNLKHMQVPASYRKDAMLSPWSMSMEKPFLGMSFRKFGPVRRNTRSVKDVWDAMLPFVDDRGILIGNNDSTDKDMVKWYDLAYYLWRDPRYVSVIRDADRRDLLYGVGELPEPAGLHCAGSAYADNAGLAVLRSRKPGIPERERLQAVLKYGSHGGYHGHFDRTGLVSIKRYGKNAYGPLASWYGYHSFMFKMWVQASLSHNMVVVDGQMQEPVESCRLMFHSGNLLQVCAVETVARWSDPPYGGQTPYPERFPEDRSLMEGREVPVPSVPRAQGELGEYSEPILQRRLMVVTDDYVVLADYVRGEQVHTYDCLHHYQGFRGLESEQKKYLRHTGKMNDDPYGAGQFISDCNWYSCTAPAVARFSHVYNRERDDRDGRHMLHNEEGRMDTDVHAVWPPQQEVMTGWYAEAVPVNKTLEYRVLGDGKHLAQDKFGAWILGKRRVSVSLRDVHVLTLQVYVDRAARKTIFWDDPCLILADGRRIHLAEMDVTFRNVDHGNGIGTDYYGGPVHLEGEPALRALPFEPLDCREPAEAILDISGMGAVAFEGTIGGDYPLGDDPARRTTVSFRSEGKEACFLTVLELHEGKPQIRRAEAESAGRLQVYLADGRRQELTVLGLESGGADIRISIEEWLGERMLRSETTQETDN